MNHRTSRASALALLFLGGAWCCTNRDETLFGGAGLAVGPAGGDDHADAGAPLQAGDAGAGKIATGDTSAADDKPGLDAPADGTPDDETPSGETPSDGLSGGELSDAGASGGCTGCVRLAGSGDYADYQLQLAADWDLTASAITWRVRVQSFAGAVSVVPYVQSGDGSTDEARLPVQTLTASQDWQELSLDLRVLDGGVSTAGVEMGASFNGTRVRRVGIAFDRTDAAASTVELDSVTFTDIPGLSSSFSSDQGGFKLVESPNVSVTLVPE